MLPDQVITRSGGGYALIRGRVLNILQAYRQTAVKPEAGGILLGSYRGDHIEVVDASTPFPSDHSTRIRFDRHREGHQQLAEQAWSNSKNTMTYIGEWHTHPESIPHPSRQDLDSWTRSLPKRDMVLLIQGLDELYINIHSPNYGVNNIPRLLL